MGLPRLYADRLPALRRGNDPVLEARSLVREFGGRRVLDVLDISVARGERVALLGPNGSGKSTLLRCFAGTLAPTSGHANVAGLPAGSLKAKRLLGVSLSQERSFFLRLTGRQNLNFFARLKLDRMSAARHVDEIVSELALSFVDDRCDSYSTGMILQLSFARALLGAPAALLLDEPTRSLDSGAVARLWSALERRPWTAVLIATHHADDVGRCTSEVRVG